jgi:hypothetical protein
LRYATVVEALRNCRAAPVGRGRIDADVVLPGPPQALASLETVISTPVEARWSGPPRSPPVSVPGLISRSRIRIWSASSPQKRSLIEMGKSRHRSLIVYLATSIRATAQPAKRLQVPTDEAHWVAGIVGLVSDHVRGGRADRLAELRPGLVLLSLLSYLGFTEAQTWAN